MGCTFQPKWTHGWTNVDEYKFPSDNPGEVVNKVFFIEKLNSNKNQEKLSIYILIFLSFSVFIALI
jgi:hypothetical protein